MYHMKSRREPYINIENKSQTPSPWMHGGGVFYIMGESVGISCYRNLLGGLYRENPVKSRNYEAVKSSKKWENVGNSYIIPALLLYRYSYI